MKPLFCVIDECRHGAHKLDAETFRTVILPLYANGLRRGETFHPTLTDVDLAEGVLTVRDTKFCKIRLVPVGSPLADVLRTCASRRAVRPMPKDMNLNFLANRDGSPVNWSSVHRALGELLRAAGINDACSNFGVSVVCQPCRHARNATPRRRKAPRSLEKEHDLALRPHG